MYPCPVPERVKTPLAVNKLLLLLKLYAILAIV